jgi:hypothetical protein
VLKEDRFRLTPDRHIPTKVVSILVKFRMHLAEVGRNDVDE